jgi:hypothetical protein
MQEPIIGPVLFCGNTLNGMGHPVCVEAHNKILEINKSNYKCPMCRWEGEPKQFEHLNEALRKILQKCTNDGCNHEAYPKDMEEHSKYCVYQAIKCPWCASETTLFDLQAHTEIYCKKISKEVSSGSVITGILSEEFSNSHITVPYDESVLLYIKNTEKHNTFLATRIKKNFNSLDPEVITLSYNSGRRTKIHINNAFDMQIGAKSISILKSVINNNETVMFNIEGEKWEPGSELEYKAYDNSWYKCTILESRIDMVIIDVPYISGGNYKRKLYLVDGNHEHIRPLGYNSDW